MQTLSRVAFPYDKYRTTEILCQEQKSIWPELQNINSPCCHKTARQVLEQLSAVHHESTAHKHRPQTARAVVPDEKMSGIEGHQLQWFFIDTLNIIYIYINIYIYIYKYIYICSAQQDLPDRLNGCLVQVIPLHSGLSDCFDTALGYTSAQSAAQWLNTDSHIGLLQALCYSHASTNMRLHFSREVSLIDSAVFS